MSKTIQTWSPEVCQFIRDNITHDQNGVLYWKTNRLRRKAGDPLTLTRVQLAPRKDSVKPRYYLQFGVVINGKLKALRVHHVVFFLHHGRQAKGNVDHIDSDSLNNAPANLREVTPQQNSQNKRPRRDNTTGFKGVHRNSMIYADGSKSYASAILLPGTRKQIHLKGSKDPVECAKAYDLASIVLHGEYGCRNFPDSNYSPAQVQAMRDYIQNKAA